MHLHPRMQTITRTAGDTGFSLVEVVVSCAIFAIIVLGLSTAYSQYFQAAKSAESWIGTNAAINQTIKLLGTPEMCDAVLRAAGGGPVNMNLAGNATIAIGEIHMKSAIDAGGTDTLVLKVGQKINEKYKVLAMTVSEQFAGVGRSTASTSKAPYGAGAALPKTWNTYVAKLTITFEFGGKQLNGSPGETVPINLAVNTSDPTDYRCYINVAHEQVCESNGGYINAAGNCVETMYDRITNYGRTKFDCQNCQTTPGPDCNVGTCAGPNPCTSHPPGHPAWVLQGFDTATGMPKCVCEWACP